MYRERVYGSYGWVGKEEGLMNIVLDYIRLGIGKGIEDLYSYLGVYRLVGFSRKGWFVWCFYERVIRGINVGLGFWERGNFKILYLENRWGSKEKIKEKKKRKKVIFGFIVLKCKLMIGYRDWCLKLSSYSIWSYSMEVVNGVLK